MSADTSIMEIRLRSHWVQRLVIGLACGSVVVGCNSHTGGSPTGRSSANPSPVGRIGASDVCPTAQVVSRAIGTSVIQDPRTKGSDNCDYADRQSAHFVSWRVTASTRTIEILRAQISVLHTAPIVDRPELGTGAFESTSSGPGQRFECDLVVPVAGQPPAIVQALVPRADGAPAACAQAERIVPLIK